MIALDVWKLVFYKQTHKGQTDIVCEIVMEMTHGFSNKTKRKHFLESIELTAAAHDTIFVEAPISILASVTFLTIYSTWAFTVSSGIQFTATIFYQRGWNCHHYMADSADFQFMIFCIPVTLVWSVTLE